MKADAKALLEDLAFKRALTSTSDVELVMSYLVLAPGPLPTRLRGALSPLLVSRARKMARARTWSRPSDLDEKTFEQELRAEALAYCNAYLGRFQTWKRKLSAQPWLGSLLKWTGGLATALIGALGLQQALIGPALLAMSADLITVTAPASRITQEQRSAIQGLSSRLWISRFAIEKLSALSSSCRDDLARGEPSVACVDAAAPLLEAIYWAETTELSQCDAALQYLPTWGDDKRDLHVPMARTFFDYDFITPALWSNQQRFPSKDDAYDVEHARLHAEASIVEYGCLVGRVAHDAAELRERLFDVRVAQAQHALGVTLRNTRGEPTDVVLLQRLRVGGASRPVSVYQIDEQGRLRPASARVVFAPQTEVQLAFFNESDASALSGLETGESGGVTLSWESAWSRLWWQTEIPLPSGYSKSRWHRPASLAPKSDLKGWSARCAF